jgi:CTP:molybdopterin cytidylyltransferase MocA
MNEVSAILLAAGQSQRMGAFKPLLPFGNTTVIESCIQNLRQAGVEEIVVVTGHRAEELQQALTGSHITFALNPNPNSEMSDSIACGLRALPSEAKATLIALTDQPAIPSEVIKAIIGQWRSGKKMVIPEFNGRGGHPVLVDLGFRGELLKLDPNGGLRSFFQAHSDQVLRLPVNSPFIARDIDTWDDYRALHKEVFGLLPQTGSQMPRNTLGDSRDPLN